MDRWRRRASERYELWANWSRVGQPVRKHSVGWSVGLKSRQVGEPANKQAASSLAGPDSHGRANDIRRARSLWLSFKREVGAEPRLEPDMSSWLHLASGCFMGSTQHALVSAISSVGRTRASALSLTHKLLSKSAALELAANQRAEPEAECCSWAKESLRELSLAKMRMFFGTMSRIEQAFYSGVCIVARLGWIEFAVGRVEGWRGRPAERAEEQRGKGEHVC